MRDAPRPVGFPRPIGRGPIEVTTVGFAIGALIWPVSAANRPRPH